MWSAQSWYPALLELLISNPLLLPKGRDLVTDPFNRLYPMEDLELAAWKVSGDSTMIWKYQTGLQSWSWLDGVQGQTQPISQPGKDGVAGVLNGKLIPFHVESNHSWILSRPFWTGLATMNQQSDTFSHFSDSPAGGRNFYWTAPTAWWQGSLRSSQFKTIKTPLHSDMGI